MLDVQTLSENIRSSGGRITPQKIAVMEAIHCCNSHPTVDQIFEQVSRVQPTLSRKTVYQIVNDLSSVGAIALVNVGTGQLRIEPTVEKAHDHFVCTCCKSVFDVERKRQPTISGSLNSFGEIDAVEVVYRGTCKQCK